MSKGHTINRDNDSEILAFRFSYTSQDKPLYPMSELEFNQSTSTEKSRMHTKLDLGFVSKEWDWCTQFPQNHSFHALSVTIIYR